MFIVSDYVGALCLGHNEQDNVGVSGAAKQWRAGKALVCLISLWIQINKQINPCINNLEDKYTAGSTAESAAQWRLIKEAQQWQEGMRDWGFFFFGGGFCLIHQKDRKQDRGEAVENSQVCTIALIRSISARNWC